MRSIALSTLTIALTTLLFCVSAVAMLGFANALAVEVPASSLMTLQPIATPLLSRRAFAKALYTQFALQGLPSNEYSLFEDLPTSDADYAVLDAVIQHHLLQPSATGYVHPDRPVTSMEAVIAIAKLLFPMQRPSASFVDEQLAQLPIQGSMDAFERSRLALVFATGVLPLPTAASPFKPRQPVEVAWFAEQLRQLQQQRLLIGERTDALNTQATLGRSRSHRFLPAGSALVMSPQQPLREGKLTPGSMLTFILHQPISLNSDSRIPAGAEVSVLLEGVEQGTDATTVVAHFRVEKILDAQQESSWYCRASFDHVFLKGSNWLHPTATHKPFWLSGDAITVLVER
jgi:hypothetical protein